MVMQTPLRIGLLGLGVCLLGVRPALTQIMSHGPLVSAVTSASATVWVRTNVAADEVQIRYRQVETTPWQETLPQATTLNTDFTVSFQLSSLSAATAYEYRVIVDTQDQLSAPYPRFTTFPSPSTAADVKFGLLADLSPWGDANVAAALALEAPDFVIILGDYDHRDPGDTPPVLTTARFMHRTARQQNTAFCAPTCSAVPGDELQTNIYDAFPVANMWDDHDYCCNNASKTFHLGSGWQADKEASFQAHQEYWRNYAPANPNEVGLWHKFTYGSAVEIYMLDLRYQRAYHGATDDCPGGSPDKSMLADDAVPGTDQKTWLKAQLLASTADFKFVISSVPWNRTVDKGDAWQGYECEQNELLAFIDANDISGVIFISGDIHTGGAIDDGTNALCPEISVPTTNVPSGDTCTFVPGQTCGDWACSSEPLNDCLRDAGFGFGIVDVDATSQTPTATLKTRSWLATVEKVFTQTVTASSMCTTP